MKKVTVKDLDKRIGGFEAAARYKAEHPTMFPVQKGALRRLRLEMAYRN